MTPTTSEATPDRTDARGGPDSGALSWRVIRDVRGGAGNMAADHALASCLESDHAVLRLYTWSRPTLSFGRNEPTVDIYSAEAADRLGVDVVRRPTGGRAVLHDAELTYAVIVPDRALGGARSTYRRVNEVLADALSSVGADVAVSGRPDGGMPGVDAGPCFQGAAEGEVVWRGRKLVGSAQARIDGALLQHGSIILDGDQTLLGDLGRAPPPEPPATLAAAVGPVDPVRLADMIAGRMEKVFGGWWSPGEYSGREKQMISELETTRYGRPEWTWRR